MRHSIAWLYVTRSELSRHLWHEVMEGTAFGIFTDGVHFPFTIVAIQLGDDQCGVCAHWHDKLNLATSWLFCALIRRQ